MLKMDQDWAHKMIDLISSDIVEKKREIPKPILVSLFTHAAQDINFGSRPKVLGEYTASALVSRLMSKFEIRATGCRILRELPIRNANVYEHSFETRDKVEFYCYQFGFAPIGSVDQLASTILELSTTTGCVHCQFKGFQEEDIECSACRNGKTRGLVRENPNCKIFRKHGWQIMQEAIGETFSNILTGFSKEYHDFFSDFEFYFQKARGYMFEWRRENEFGAYFSKEVEHDLFLSIEELGDGIEGDGGADEKSWD